MIYKDEKLEKRPLDIESPFYAEMLQLRELGSTFEPNETLPFYKNLIAKYKFDLRIKYLKEILEIKREYYYETGEIL